MDSKQIKRVTTRKLGKMAVSYAGLLRTARALRKRYGKKSLYRDYLIETNVTTYHMKNGSKRRTIGREL